MMVFAATSAAHAAPPAVVDSAKALIPFLDQSVMAVIRIDAAHLDLKVAEGWLAERLRAGIEQKDKKQVEQMNQILADLAKQRAGAEEMLTSFQQAGARDAYVIVSMGDIFAGPPPMFIPLAPGADAQKIMAMLPPKPGAARIGDMVVIAPEATRQRVREVHDSKEAHPADPNLLEALVAGSPGAAVHVAFAPSLPARAAFSALAPTLPPQLGGGPSGPVVRGLRWASITLKMPPTPSLRLMIQAQDAQSAEAIEKVITTGLREGAKAIEEQAALPKNASEAASMRKFAAMVPTIAPKREGDHLAIVLEEPRLNDFTAVAGNGLIRARRSAMRVRSMSNIKQLLQASLMWSNDHKREWPDALADAIKLVSLPPEFADNPSKPGTGYTYVKPAKDVKNIQDRIVLYETESDSDGRGVGFADGHAQWMTEEEFKAALKAQDAEK